MKEEEIEEATEEQVDTKDYSSVHDIARLSKTQKWDLYRTNRQLVISETAVWWDYFLHSLIPFPIPNYTSRHLKFSQVQKIFLFSYLELTAALQRELERTDEVVVTAPLEADPQYQLIVKLSKVTLHSLFIEENCLADFANLENVQRKNSELGFFCLLFDLESIIIIMCSFC